jgi:hypothetical protein
MTLGTTRGSRQPTKGHGGRFVENLPAVRGLRLIAKSKQRGRMRRAGAFGTRWHSAQRGWGVRIAWGRQPQCKCL